MGVLEQTPASFELNNCMADPQVGQAAWRGKSVAIMNNRKTSIWAAALRQPRLAWQVLWLLRNPT